MATRGCINSPDCFCYICGYYTIKKRQRNISDFVEKVYFAYFGIKLGNQDKSCAPHKFCSICVEELRQWFQGKKLSLRYGIPIFWREPENHSDDCYFCSCNVQGFNLKNKKDISYSKNQSAIRPISYGPGVPIPSPPDSFDDNLNDHETLVQQGGSEKDGDCYNPCTTDPIPFSQSQLNNLLRNLGLPKDSAEVVGSRLKDKNMLAPGTSFSWYRSREKEFVSFFSQEGNLVLCSDVPGLMACFKIEYAPDEWRLFIDSSKRSLKAVLLHNGNKYASMPVGHLVHLKECYENLELILNKLNYSDHKWTLCGDLKSGYTKFPCFLCKWDSRDRKQQYIKKVWPLRKTLELEVKNVERKSLVDPKKVLLPPLRIKLGLMKQFVKELPKEGETFK